MRRISITMKLEKGVISSSQLISLIGIFIQGSIFSTVFVFEITPKDAWLVSLTSLAMFVPFAWAYVKLMQMFPGKNLIQINDIVFGRYLGKSISVLYILFIIVLAATNLGVICDSIAGLFMVETPIIALAIMLAFACAWAVRNGIETIARISLIFLTIVSISVLLSLLLIASKIDMNNLLPVLDISLIDFIQVNHISLTAFFGGIFVFMMVIPYMDNIKKGTKSVFMGLIIGVATMLACSVMISGVLGNVAIIANSPLISATRQVEVSKVLTRMDFIVVGILVLSVFMKIALIYYTAALSISQLLNLQTYKPIVIPVGIILVGLVIPMFDNPTVRSEIGMNTWPFFASIFEFLLPAVTLLVALIRRLPQKQGEKC